MVVVVGRESWMIDVPFLQYFSLTGAGYGCDLKC